MHYGGLTKLLEVFSNVGALATTRILQAKKLNCTGRDGEHAE